MCDHTAKERGDARCCYCGIYERVLKGRSRSRCVAAPTEEQLALEEAARKRESGGITLETVEKIFNTPYPLKELRRRYRLRRRGK